MKRLLASGSGDIYQIGPAFRADECGRRHRPEFTLLEWYRVGRTHHQLMDDVEALLRALGLTCPIARLSYTKIFADAFGAPSQALATTQLADLVRRHGLELGRGDQDDRALLLNGLFVQVIEPPLAREGALFLYDYPPELRAYARLSAHEPQVAERFELIIDGLEIANGYHEITDRAEQAACFEAENALRARRQLPQVPADEGWLAALGSGLPSCAGVALGIERLMMAMHGLGDIAEVLGCDELI